MANTPISQMTATWNNGLTAYTAIGMDVADAASDDASRLISLEVGGVEKFGVRKDGVAFLTGFADTVYVADPSDDTKQVRLDAGNVTAGQTRVITAPDYNLDMAKLLRVDDEQSFSSEEKGHARANIGADTLGGFRNKVVNGNFDHWQQATSQTSFGYGSDDCWLNTHSGSSTKTHSRQSFTVGQTDVPGGPRYYSRTAVTSGNTSTSAVVKEFRVPDVRKLAGKLVTFTFYARADASRNISCEFAQTFGTGGSPSSSVNAVAVLKSALTTSWQRIDVVGTFPSVSGKTLGSDDNDYSRFILYFDAGSSLNARTDSLGNQSGTFDIAHVSLVEGDAHFEDDPFGYVPPEIDLLLCMERGQWLRSGTGKMTITNRCLLPISFVVPMRATPTLTLVDGTNGLAVDENAGGNLNINTLTAYFLPSRHGGLLDLSVATTTAGFAVSLRDNRIWADANL